MTGAATAGPDRHRQVVYDLEEVAFGGTVYEDPMPFADAADLVVSFCSTGWWAGLGLPVPTVLRTRRDSGRSYARTDGEPSIHLSPEGCTAATIAHELAHLVVALVHGGGDPGHGPAFRRADVALVGALLGEAAADRLAGAFAMGGLDLDRGSDDLPPPGGFWATWRAERALAARPGPDRPPIAL